MAKREPKSEPKIEPICTVVDEMVTVNYEKRYCICNVYSYGDMVSCDKKGCLYGNWFHFGCVGIQQAPSDDDEWYCEGCVKDPFLARK